MSFFQNDLYEKPAAPPKTIYPAKESSLEEQIILEICKITETSPGG